RGQSGLNDDLYGDCSIATGAHSKIARQEQGESTWDPLNASELAPNSANGLIPTVIAWAKSQPPGNVAIVTLYDRLLAELHRDSLYPMMGKDAWVAGADRREAPGPKPVRLGRRLRPRRQPPGSWQLWNGGDQRGVSIFGRYRLRVGVHPRLPPPQWSSRQYESCSTGW